MSKTIRVVLSRRLYAAAVSGLVIASVLGGLTRAVTAQSNTLSPEQVATILAEVSTFGRESLQISPDGEWVIYAVERRELKTNTPTTEIFVQRIPHADGPVQDPIRLPDGAKSLRWVPGSSSLSMIVSNNTSGSKPVLRFVRFEVPSGKITPLINVREHNGPEFLGENPIGGDYVWSPSGKYVAFTAPLSERGKLDPTRGIPVSEFTRGALSGLFVTEVSTQKTVQVTPSSASVHDFCWSPDETKLAVSIKEFPLDHFTLGLDLFVVSRTGGDLRTLVKQTGTDYFPSWSPDGKWIALMTQKGQESYTFSNKIAGIVPAAGGPVKVFSGSIDNPSVSEFPFNNWKGWSSDSKSFYYMAATEMERRLIRADVDSLRFERVPLARGGNGLFTTEANSLSPDRRWMVYLQSSVSTPPELFVTALDDRGNPTGQPRQMTRLTPEFALRDAITTQVIEWPSPDGKFTIHSLLVLPGNVAKNGTPTKPLPTLLFMPGGPSMVTYHYAPEGLNGGLLALAARGYAVLVPNTRGRAGYGEVFGHAIRDGKTGVGRPFEDAMAGVDLLIKRGIADPARLGIFGHSYGGTLTEYAITRTNRFKAAVLHESVGYDPSNLVLFDSNSFWRILFRDLRGVHDPFDPAEKKRILDEAPALNLDRVKTPTLTIVGSVSIRDRISIPFYNGLRRFKVPSAIFIYEDGHVFRKPKNIADDLTRVGEWMDYWVRGIPFPDAKRAAEYDVDSKLNPKATGSGVTRSNRADWPVFKNP